MNIIKQIKLYREVKDYMIKNPSAVHAGCRLNCEYGDVNESYHLRLSDKYICATEYQQHAINPLTYKVSITYENDTEKTYTGILAKRLFMLMSRRRVIQNQKHITTFGINR